ncbi:MAG: zf-HC2 domain-containing protein [Candidatus Eisenbacteria bacterium]
MSRPDRLTCEELFRRLDDFMDRELHEDEATLVREHLETCAVCAAEYSFESSMLTSVREKLRHIAAPPDLMAKISARLARTADGEAG